MYLLAGILLVVAASAFLALQLWIIVTPLRHSVSPLTHTYLPVNLHSGALTSNAPGTLQQGGSPTYELALLQDPTAASLKQSAPTGEPPQAELDETCNLFGSASVPDSWLDLLEPDGSEGHPSPDYRQRAAQAVGDVTAADSFAQASRPGPACQQNIAETSSAVHTRTTAFLEGWPYLEGDPSSASTVGAPSGSSSAASAMTRSNRKQLAAVMDKYWSQFYDQYGDRVEVWSRRGGDHRMQGSSSSAGYRNSQGEASFQHLH